MSEPRHADVVLDLWHWQPARAAAAAFALGRRGKTTPEACAKLCRLLEHRDAYVREAAAQAVGQLEVRGATAALVRLLSDEAQPLPVRDTAAYALSLLADPAAFGPLYLVAARAQGDPRQQTLFDRALDALQVLVTTA